MSLYDPKWAMVITWVGLRRFGTEEFTTEVSAYCISFLKLKEVVLFFYSATMVPKVLCLFVVCLFDTLSISLIHLL